jgi:hypothetical protein
MPAQELEFRLRARREPFQTVSLFSGEAQGRRHPGRFFPDMEHGKNAWAT